jgi:FkbM family methyltransferase
MRNHIDMPFDNVAEIDDAISAYRLILGRNPEKSELKFFEKSINFGMPADRLFQSFINSVEYKQKTTNDEKIQSNDCGGYYVCAKKSEKDFGQAIVENKTWEPHIIDVLSKSLQKGDTFVDVGANVGVMTFLGAKIVGTSGKVVAVEPNPNNLQLLYAGIIKNKFKQVHVLPFAASNKMEIFSLDGGTSNTYLTVPEQGKDYVQSVVLDDILISLDSIDVVKIDIEGHETYAIEGFRKLLKLHKPLILTEFNPSCLEKVSGIHPMDCLELFFKLFENIKVIEHSGTQSLFKSAGEIWRYWKDKNKEAVRTNWLPDGMLHFDILAKVK